MVTESYLSDKSIVERKKKMNEKIYTGYENNIAESEQITLFDLCVGQKGKILDVFLEDNMRRRVSDLGMSRGTPVTCYAYAPTGDPGAYEVRGSVIALRRDDAAKIIVEPWI